MGLTKRYLEWSTANGMSLASVDGRLVCPACFGDEAIQAFVREKADEGEVCEFCGDDSEGAANLADVVEFVHERLYQEYDDANECLGWDGREGGWQGVTWTADELLDEVGLDLPHDDDGNLRDAIAEGLGDKAFCERNPYGGSEAEFLTWSWEHFVKTVTSRIRFFFLDETDADQSLLSPAALLARLANMCESLEFARTVVAGTRLFRARIRDDGTTPIIARDFGPPPADARPQSNRMNAPGIPALYASFDADTAFAEVGGECVVGELELLREAFLLDLSRLPQIPSIFEGDPNRMGLIFLHRFARDVAMPVARDDRVHVDYVPSQVVTEYFRHRVLIDGRRLDGIVYASAQRPNGLNVVLFAEPGCIETTDSPALTRSVPWLRVVSWSKRS